MILRAKWLVDRSLEVHDGGKVDTGIGSGEVDLGDAILMPGLVNAHCHLDYTDMRWKIDPPRGFTQWIEQITAVKRSWSDDDYVRSIDAGMREAMEFGTTCMGNWTCAPQVMSRVQSSPMRIWWFWEQIAFRANNVLPEWNDWPAQVAARSANWKGALAPHAPYTCRDEIVHRICEWSDERKLPWSIHIAESVEESLMFEKGEGDLFQLLKKSGRPMDDCGDTTPLQWLLPILKDARTAVQLVHGNTFTPDDLKLLEKLILHPSSFILSLIYCPRSRRYFSHPEFSFSKLKRKKINMALGTDSLASNSNLSMFEEMNLMARENPDLDPREIVAMATVCGARSLGVADKTWKTWQDWIAIPCETSKKSVVWEAISRFTGKPFFAMLDGQIIFQGAAV